MPWFRREQSKPLDTSKRDFFRQLRARELRKAEAFAMMLAHDRQSETLDITDLLAGIYITQFDKLVQFWPDADTWEDFVETHCHINRERWLYWFQYCDHFLKAPKGLRLGRFSIPRHSKRSFVGKLFTYSTDLQTVLTQAEALTPHRMEHPVSRKEVPLLTSECVLLAVARHSDLDIGRHLLHSGLDVTRLEEAVRSPKSKPKD